MRLSEVRVVSSQRVELLGSRVLVSSVSGRLAESSRDLVEGAALRLGQLEVGEDEEAEQQHGEDDEDVRAAQLLEPQHKLRVRPRAEF